MDNVIRRDDDTFKNLKALLDGTEDIGSWDDIKLKDVLSSYFGRLDRLRMGGRSSPLIALSILLWFAHDREPVVDLDVENRLNKAFQIAMDPSYLYPEWGLVLAGVLIARYLGRLPKRVQGQIEMQSRLLLEYLKSNGHASPSIPHTAGALLKALDGGFASGLDPVVKTCASGWPDTASMTEMSDTELDEAAEALSREALPGAWSVEDRILCRAFLEKKHLWKAFESISLT